MTSFSMKRHACPRCSCSLLPVCYPIHTHVGQYASFIEETLRKTFKERSGYMRARELDPTTSKAAGMRNSNIGKSVLKALFVVGQLERDKANGLYGATDKELEAEFTNQGGTVCVITKKFPRGKDVSVAGNMSPVRWMLEQCGFVRDSGFERSVPNVGSKGARYRGIVWELVPEEEFKRTQWVRKETRKPLDDAKRFERGIWFE